MAALSYSSSLLLRFLQEISRQLRTLNRVIRVNNNIIVTRITAHTESAVKVNKTIISPRDIVNIIIISKSLVLEMSHIWLYEKLNKLYKDLNQIYQPLHQFWPQSTTLVSTYRSFIF